MSYFYVDSATTQKGKIIYRRKPHVFQACDLLRIAKTMPSPATFAQWLCQLDATRTMILKYRDIDAFDLPERVEMLRESLVNLAGAADSFSGFGGGEFGGGGASGEFGLPLDVSSAFPGETAKERRQRRKEARRGG